MAQSLWIWLERVDTALSLLMGVVFIVARIYFYVGPEGASKRIFAPLAASRSIRAGSQWYIALVGVLAVILAAYHLLFERVLPPSTIVSLIMLALAGTLLLGCDVWIAETRRGGDRLLDGFDGKLRDWIEIVHRDHVDPQTLHRFVVGLLATGASLVGPDPIDRRTGRACVYLRHNDNLKIWVATQRVGLESFARNVYSLRNVDTRLAANEKVGAVTWVYHSRQFKAMNDYRSDRDYLDKRSAQSRREYIGTLMLPIMPPTGDDADPMGVLCIDKTSCAPFTQRDVSVAVVLGNFLTLAMKKCDVQQTWDGDPFMG
jgi:hypothetical protein